MKIGLCQFRSPETRSESIRSHVEAAERAAADGCELVLFPELSLTGYGLSAIAMHALDPGSPVMADLSQASVEHSISIAVGVPLLSMRGGAEIGLVVFQPDGSRCDYAKQLLHPEEKPFFVPGDRHLTVSIAAHHVGFGICYEALQPTHGAGAIERGATIYAASVAKHSNGMEEARRYLASFAKSNRIPTVVVNAVGPSEGFVCSGGSAAWSADGDLLGELLSEEGTLVVDL